MCVRTSDVTIDSYDVQGGLRQLSVGTTQVWGVKSDGGVSVRMGITADSPAGQEWVTVDGEPMRCVR